MTPKRHSTTRRSSGGLFLGAGLALCAAIALVVAIALNVSAAGAGSTNASTLGLTETSDLKSLDEQTAFDISDAGSTEGTVLTTSSQRNIDKAVDEMLAKEEAERIAAEEAKRIAEEKQRVEMAALQARSAGDAAVAGLEPVDWMLDEAAFIEHWGARIDAYLGNSPLAGQGVTFATAAWNNRIDPRLSPAISNTESSKGQICFLPHNAWGWGQSSWSSWEEAINGHVSGLASGGYGPIVTYEGAKRYCPPNYDNWYRDTTAEMGRI